MALAFAAGAGNLTCMRTLLELGADAATVNGKGVPHAIHKAAHSGAHTRSFVCVAKVCCIMREP